MEEDKTAEAAALFSSLRERGVALWSDGGVLRWRAAKGAFTSRQFELCKSLKQELMALVPLGKEGVEHHVAQLSVQRAYTAPLSYQQEWALTSWMASGEQTVMREAFRLRGPLSVDALRDAFDSVIRRNESLRTRLVSEHGVLKQHIDIHTGHALNLLNVANHSLHNAETEAKAAIREFLGQPIDMAVGPNIRSLLVTLGGEEHALAIAVHHIISDGDALFMLLRELWVRYRDIVTGSHDTLPAVRLQYPAYALAQRSTGAPKLMSAKRYWDGRLTGARPVRLPIDARVGNVDRFSHAQCPFAFDKALTSTLEHLARSERTSLAMILLASFVGTLGHWSSQRDFVIPFVVNGRGEFEDVSVMGYLSHFVPLRFQLAENESFIDLLKATTDEFRAAVTHLDFGLAISERPDLFEGVSLQWMPWGPSDIGLPASSEWGSPDSGLVVSDYPGAGIFQPEEARLTRDVDWELWNTENGVSGVCWYRRDRFSADTINKLIRDLCLGLRSAVSDPQSRHYFTSES